MHRSPGQPPAGYASAMSRSAPILAPHAAAARAGRAPREAAQGESKGEARAETGGAAKPRRPRRRDQILRTAAQLFAARGFHAVGIAELGDAVALGRGSLYHHIGSKEDLLYDISREYIADLSAHATEVVRRPLPPAERLALLGDYLMLKIASHQAELTVCFREVQSLTGERHREVMALHAAYEGAWKKLLRDGEAAGVFRPYDPIVLKGLLGMYFYSYLWLKPSGRTGPRDVAERFNAMALASLAP